MATATYIFSVVLFLATAPVLLIIRLYRPKQMPWWLLVFLAVTLGWLWLNLSVHLHFRHLEAVIMQLGGFDLVPQQLIDRWTADGGKKVGALFFGWLYGIAYLAVWLVLYAALAIVAKMLSTRRIAA